MRKKFGGKSIRRAATLKRTYKRRPDLNSHVELYQSGLVLLRRDRQVFLMNNLTRDKLYSFHEEPI
jgi:hypothetical protein